MLRLAARSHLTHLVATNEFFVRLRHTARVDATATLDRWWSERTSTTRVPRRATLRARPVDHQKGTAGFLLERDLGTMPLSRLTAKLAAYGRLARSGDPRYPALFWLPNATREANCESQ